MPVCSYLVIAAEGEAAAVAAQLTRLRGCEVTPAENGDVLILVTDTAGAAEDTDLRDHLGEIEGIQALLLTFGELWRTVGEEAP